MTRVQQLIGWAPGLCCLVWCQENSPGSQISARQVRSGSHCLFFPNYLFKDICGHPQKIKLMCPSRAERVLCLPLEQVCLQLTVKEWDFLSSGFLSCAENLLREPHPPGLFYVTSLELRGKGNRCEHGALATCARSSEVLCL